MTDKLQAELRSAKNSRFQCLFTAATFGIAGPAAAFILGNTLMQASPDAEKTIRAEIIAKHIGDTVTPQIKSNARDAAATDSRSYTFNIQAQATLDLDQIEKETKDRVAENEVIRKKIIKVESLFFLGFGGLLGLLGLAGHVRVRSIEKQINAGKAPTAPQP